MTTRPTLRALLERARGTLGDLALRRNVEDPIARVLAGAAHGLHGRIRWAGDQSMPDGATGARLDVWARAYLLERTRAAKASGGAWFIVAGSETVPVATRLRDDYGNTYVVTESEPFTTGAGFTSVLVEAEEVGADQNLDELEGLHLLEPIAGVTSPGFVFGDLLTDPGPYPLEGGADLEADEDLRDRLLARIGDEPLGGAPGDYVTLALAGGAALAWERPNASGDGTVDLYIGDVTDAVAGVDPGGAITTATTAKIAEVQAYVDEHCPITVDVTVASVAVATKSLTVALTPDSSEIREAVELELRAMFLREAIANGPGNSIPVSRIGEAIGLAAGLTSHVITVPSSPWSATAGAVLADASITYV